MPELPEVETVRRTLEYQLLNDTIERVDVVYDKMLHPSKDAFVKLLPNQTFRELRRYGKYLIFIFDTVSIISHLRMEGKYFIKHNEIYNKHEHIAFYLKSGRTLRYHDVRKFGTMKLLNTTDFGKIMQDESLAKLGPEANDPTLTKEYLFNKINKLNIPMKTVLLNQEIICGLGNIYVDEVLFLSKIHPLRLASNVSLEECDLIVNNSRKVLAGAIAAGGTTIRSYTSSLGVTGLFQLKLHVHTKVGFPCENCQTTIEKIQVGGRGTYFCRHCQTKTPFVVGVTGGIASGKTNVVNYLMENYPDYEYIDTDLINHELLTKSEVIQELVENFGEEIVIDGLINRKVLGSIIYNDEQKRLLLNSILHPKIIKIVKNKLKQTKKTKVFLVVPLLFETNMDELVDEIWFVTIPEEIQIDRLMKRDNISYEYALQKINSQMSYEEKNRIIKKKQNVVLIDNSKELCYTYDTINKLMNK